MPKCWVVLVEQLQMETGEICITFSQGGQVVGVDCLRISGNAIADKYQASSTRCGLYSMSMCVYIYISVYHFIV